MFTVPYLLGSPTLRGFDLMVRSCFAKLQDVVHVIVPVYKFFCCQYFLLDRGEIGLMERLERFLSCWIVMGVEQKIYIMCVLYIVLTKVSVCSALFIKMLDLCFWSRFNWIFEV